MPQTPDDEVPFHLQAMGEIPSTALYVTEPFRGIADAALLPIARPLLRRAPKGDGHGVLVLPGLLASDTSTAPLRRFLRERNYYVRGWRLGRNLGPSEAIIEGIPQALRDLVERTDGPVSIIGWSLGGIYARTLALDHPDMVRQVITLGSPFGVAHGHKTRADGAFERLRIIHARPRLAPDRSRLADALSVPSTALYSKLDGVVPWRACIGEDTELHQNVEVRCSHLGFGFDPATIWCVTDRLAQDPDNWRRFKKPSGLASRLYKRVG
ncbi:MAG: alpha/beta hydrolase [Actinomycetia bacterium]|nr:alpha/beta hydrolase [Actinomycetes bacterium]